MGELSTSAVRGLVQVCAWALGHAMRRKGTLTLALAAMLAKIGMDVLRPWPMKVLVDHALQHRLMSPGLAQVVHLLPGTETSQGLITWCIVATVVVFLLGWALGLAGALANLHFGQCIVYDLAADLYGHLLGLSQRFHGRKPVGDNIRRATTDCSCVTTIVQDALMPLVVSAVTLLAMFAVMYRLDPLLTVLSLAVVPWLVFVLHRYAGPMLERGYAQQQAEGRLYDIVEQTLSAMPVVQAFGQEPSADRRFRRTSATALDAALSCTSVQLQFKILTGLATAVGTAAILWIGGLHVLDGQLSIGSILVFLSYLASLYGPLESLMYTTSTVQGAAGSARRVQEVLGTEPEVADRPGSVALRQPRGQVRLDQVTFGYQPDRPVLRSVSLEAHPGQVVALIGPTGAGKTTLVSLVPRFFDPWQGRVLFDGQDVRGLRLKSLRAQVALVLQEPLLFPWSIAQNIAYGRPTATRKEVEAAARAARLEECIGRLPEGYETVLGERGATLSGGERQRLSIARALLKRAPVLILDEPTSALDAQTESLLLEALKELMQGRTTLVIAHRLSTIRHADQIVVLDHGQIIEHGSHDQLLARPGLYRRWHDMQFHRSGRIPVEASP